MIKVALTNLGKYNEGELVYTWLELPASSKEISDALDVIGINGTEEYEEHFISDYESPFEIGEYDDLEKLNDMAEELESIDIPDTIFDGTYDATDVINFAMELCNEGIVPSADEYVHDIISDEELDEMTAHIAQDGGWQRVRHFLGGIDFMNDDYYWINGYGNAEDLDKDHLENIVDDLLHEMFANLER